MSRRKQAKPRSLKREDLQSAVFEDESTQDTLTFSDTKISVLTPESPTEHFETSSVVSEDHHSLYEEDDELEEEEEDEDLPNACSSCKQRFETLTEYLQHLNQDGCMTGGGSQCGGGGGSDDVSLSPSGGCPTPSSGDSELAYTVGVTENTPYGCQFCDKAFPRLSYLKRHEQIHSDQMPFRCDYCQRLFKHKRSRDRHVKLHTGDRKYRCSQCESAFSRSDHLKIHLRTHDNGKPYQCAVCNRGYNTAAALSSHMQNHKNAKAAVAEQQQVMDLRNGREDGPSPDPSTKLPLCPSSSSPALHRSSFSSSSPLSSESPSAGGKSCNKCLEELSSPNAACTHRKAHPETEPDKSSPDIRHQQLQQPHDRFSPAKLTCGFCSQSDFPTHESLQLHVQVMHVPTAASRESVLAASIRSLQSMFHSKRLQHAHVLDNFLGGYSGLECDPSGFSALHLLQKHAALGESLLLKRPSDIYCSQCNVGFTSSAALLDHVHLIHETTLSRSPSSPLTNHTSKRSLASSRLRPNGTKHMKTSPSPHSTMFNGTSSSHYRRQDPGGGQGLAQGHSPDSNPSTLLCSQCSAGFGDFESFRTHLKSHLDAAAGQQTTPRDCPATAVPCPECGTEFPSEQLLDAHVVAHFLCTTTEYGCAPCAKLFRKPDELQRHLMEVHAHHLYKCALCRQVFDSKVSIQVHFAVKHSNECRSLKCTSCNAYFRTEMEFQVHVKLNHLSAAKPPFHNNNNSSSSSYRCLLCDQFFPSELQLRFHAATHKKEFACSACGEAFHVEFLLDKHIQAVHQGSTKHQFQAGVPAQATAAAGGGGQSSSAARGPDETRQLNEEAQNLCMKKTNGPSRGDRATPSEPSAPITSPLTPSSSPQPSNAAKSPPTLHRCDICDVTCTSESGLAAHRRQAHHLRLQKDHSKTSNGPASAVSLFCAYCNESCKSRGELENHMKAHTATPSKHKCNICDEICPSATTLAEHKLTHCKVVSGSTCIVCRVQLVNEDQFISHIQQHSNSQGTTSSNSNGLPVPCVICRQTLVVDVEVKMHARFHLQNTTSTTFESSTTTTFESPTTTPCCVCSRVFDHGSLIIRASPKDHLPHTYMCKECFHSKGVLRCGECGVKFESFGDLDCHRRSAHQQLQLQEAGKKTFQCIKCQVVFESEAEIEAHVACHVLQEGTQHECKLCHEVLDSPSKLQCHLIEHSFEGSSHFTCYLCSAVFASSTLLQRHMFEHGLDSRPYDCGDCRQKFFFRAELENHSFVHMWESMGRLNANSTVKGNGENQRLLYECPMCPSVFSNFIDLAKHQRTAHNHDAVTFKQETLGRNLVPCPECGMEFTSSDDLRGHMILLHPSSRDAFVPDRVSLQDFYKFDDDKTLEDKTSPSVHGKSAKEKKAFECPVCKKRFTRRENRKLHMKSHHPLNCDSSKTFPCSQCEKVFLKRSEVKEHMKQHLTSNSYTCDVCDESFSFSAPLRHHQRDTHSKTFEHTCIVCSEPFDEERELLDHQDQHHQVKLAVTALEEPSRPEVEPKIEVESCPASPETRPEDEVLETVIGDSAADSELTMETDYNESEERTNLPTEVAA